MKRTHVCAEPGCPQLTPCPTHGRRPGESWGQRDTKMQNYFRRAVASRANGVCERCLERPGVVAHHVRPGFEPECGLWLCDDCHKAIDTKARTTRR